jgi:hypothetical protein
VPPLAIGRVPAVILDALRLGILLAVKLSNLPMFPPPNAVHAASALVLPVPPWAIGRVPNAAAPLVVVAYKAPLFVAIILIADVAFPARIALSVRVDLPVPPRATEKYPLVILEVAKLGISSASKVLNVAFPLEPFGAANTVLAVLEV